MLALVAALLMQASPASPPAASSFEALSREAAEARDARRLDQALALYKKALQLKPGWEDGLWAAASIEYDQDKYAECAADFERLAALKPDQVPARTMAGLCEYHLRDYKAALKSLTEVQRLGSQEQTELARAARIHLALVLIKLNNFEKAIATLVELTRIDKKTQDIVVASGIAGLRKPWTPPEVPESVRDEVFKLGDAMAAVMEQDNQQALEKFAVVMRDYPGDPNVHFRYGAFLMQQNPERGIEEIRKTLELEPDHIPALVSLAAIYLKRDQAQTAREYAEKAVKLDPADFATHVTLGRVLLDTDEAAGAAREFETAVKLAPASPESHFNLASAYAKLGRKEDAARERQEFKRLRKLAEPNQP
jgi:tetratricopeptide (TPR) repeat protein